MGSPLLGLWRLATYLSWTAIMLPVQMVAVRFGWRSRKRIPRFYHRICTRLLGFNVVQRGRPVSTAGPVLYVSNHSSYLDITILGSVLEASFIAKEEVKSWPFFGLLARLQQSVFVDRRLVTVDAQRAALQARLEAGDNLILFPEGTSSDGNRTLPFKSALFAVAAIESGGQKLTVQPISVTCTALDGIPLGRTWRDVYAWYGETGLLSHLWRMIRLGRLTVVVAFHEPTSLAAAGTRKALADQCWQAVAGGVAAANAGRLALAT